jgi:hypothetical protein
LGTKQAGWPEVSLRDNGAGDHGGPPGSRRLVHAGDRAHHLQQILKDVRSSKPLPAVVGSDG